MIRLLKGSDKKMRVSMGNKIILKIFLVNSVSKKEPRLGPRVIPAFREGYKVGRVCPMAS